MLRPGDRDRATEIANYAQYFGAREATTYELMASLVDAPERVFHTMDDAMLLTSDGESAAAVAAMDLPERYIVVSFSNG